MKRSIAVVQSHSIILVLGKGLSQSLNDLIGTPGVVCIRRSQRRPFHVGPEMFLMGNHHVDRPFRMIMMIHVCALTGKLSLGRLTCLGRTNAVRRSEPAY
ncbi:MAG: hypothetical protein KGJ82_02065 [Nitrospirota bacterium]|nr:hypothetical protein [Nitrospirota bacterium]